MQQRETRIRAVDALRHAADIIGDGPDEVYVPETEAATVERAARAVLDGGNVLPRDIRHLLQYLADMLEE